MMKKRIAPKGLILAFILLLVNLTPAKGNDTVTAYGIVQNYLKAIGGREKLGNVLDRVTEMEGDVQKVHVTMVIYQKQPDKFKQVTNAGEVQQVILYSQERGQMKINDKVTEITGDELTKLKNDATLNLLLHLDTNRVHLKLLGIDTINGKPAYKILLKSSTFNWTHYYDVKSYLKVMDDKPVKAAAGTFIQSTWYSDYREVAGIMFPFKIKQKLGKQQMEFNVTSIKVNSGITDDEFKLD